MSCVSLDNFYNEADQQQPTEFRPIRISDGTSYPDVYDADRFKVIETENRQAKYRFGSTATTLTFVSGEVVLSIAVVNTSNNQNGTVRINGGDLITISGGESFEAAFIKGTLVNPVIEFSANLKWFVDWII